MTPPHSPDLNLLFGILAMQNELVTRDQLVEAMNAWLQAKHRPLGDLLRERGALVPEDQAVIDALVQRHLARCNQDAERCLRALSLAPSAHSALSALGDADVQTGLSHVSPSTAIEPGGDADAGPARATGAMRYRILRPHARGGLGEVFVAEDMELHREVALKEIQRRHAHEHHGRARFLMEAEITGRLEHPGVVPVYGLGAYADGRPYYAMRFIRGESLKDALDRFHAGAQKGSFASLEFRQLLGRFISVCNAIAYAHSRGVLHRDLKPSNVMLGPFGETLVVDWGLAKVVGTQRGDKPSPDGVDATLRPSSGSSAVETVAGAAIGTPAFMSPEQAEGKIDALGPATDIYSLGATLYVLLTGNSPVQGATAAEVLEKVRQGIITPPGVVRPNVPRALEAVCMKAMSLRPGDRYPSAQDLAQDVERWLADEPVAVYREPWLKRTGRWARKHKALVTTAAAVLLTATIGLAFGMYFVNAEKNRVAQEKKRADAQTAIAQQEKNRADAQTAIAQAVNEFFLQDILAQANPEQHPDRDLKLRTVLDVAAQRVPDRFKGKPVLEASIRLTLGDAYRALGEFGPAREHLENAFALRRDHLGEDQLETIQAMLILARTCRMHQDWQRSQALYSKALEISKKVQGEEHPDSLTALHGLGTLLNSRGQNAEAEQLFLKVVEARRRVLGSEHPQTLKSLTYLATSYLNQAKYKQADTTFQELLKSSSRILGEHHPDTLDATSSYARILAQQKRYAEAEPLQQKAVARLRSTLGDTREQTLLAMTELAWIYHAQGKRQEEAAVLRQLVEAIHRHPQKGSQAYAAILVDMGARLYYREAFADAELLLRECLALREKLIPDSWLVFNTKATLGAALTGQGKYAEAEPLLIEGYEGMKAREATIPPEGRVRLVEAIGRLVRLYEAWNKPDKANEWRQKLSPKTKPAANQSSG